jgi:hypothetical protein
VVARRFGCWLRSDRGSGRFRRWRSFPWRLLAATPVVLGLACARGEKGPQAPESARFPPGVATQISAVTEELSNLFNQMELKYQSLAYEWNEDLLDRIDRAEAFLSGSGGDQPRLMPTLDAEEEAAHLRETIRRWEAKTGRRLRDEIDVLKAELAKREPGKAYYPEFQKRFSEIFDDFIKIEVEEIRERRNRALHAAARPILEKYRNEQPEVVAEYERILNRPPYQLPEGLTPEPAGLPEPQPAASAAAPKRGGEAQAAAAAAAGSNP